MERYLSMLHRRPPHDVLIAVALFGLAGIFGAGYLAAIEKYPAGYWQEWWLAPSAMMAAGHGYVMPDPMPAPLGEFLKRNIEALPPDSIPADIAVRPAGAFHEAHRYLMYAVALSWKVFGISWRALLPVYALLCGMTALAAYALFRLGMGRALALLMTTIFLVSPVHLYALPLLRDYGKAPFFLGVLFLLGYLITRPLPPRRMLAVCAALGVVAGIGFGFRMDLMIAYWGALMGLFFFLPGPLLPSIKWRFAAVLVVFVTVQTAAFPVLYTSNKLNMSGHAAQGGFVQTHDRALGVGGVPYTWTRLMNDYYMFAFVESHAHFMDGESERVDYLTEGHQEAAKSYMKTLAWNFPRDVYLRINATVLRILQQSPAHVHPSSPDDLTFTNDIQWGSYRVLAPLLGHLAWAGPLYALLAVAIAASVCLRRGVALLFFIFCFGGYCFLQFANRHYFHLAVLPLWLFAFVLNAAALWLWALRHPERRTALLQRIKAPQWRQERGILQAAGLLAFALVGLAAGFLVLGIVQQAQVKKLYANYQGAAREPVAYELLPDTPSPGMTLLKPSGLFDAAAWPESRKAWNNQMEMLVLEYEDPALERLWFWPQYTAPAKAIDFTHYAGEAWLFPSLSPRTLRFEPVFETPDIFQYSDGVIKAGRKFGGIALLTPQAAGLKAVYRIPNPEQLGFLTALSLPVEGWESIPRQQSFQPYPLPAPLRALRAQHGNYLPNGSFEQWDANTPEGFGAPSADSTIQPAMDFVSRGERSARQQWTAQDADAAPEHRFHTLVPALDPATEYELFVSVKNESKVRVRIEAWLMPQKQRIAVPIRIAPAAGFREHRGSFTTPPGNRADILLCVSLEGALEPDTQVTWDDWRLVKAPNYGLALRY